VKQTHNPPAQPLPKGHYEDRVEHAATPTSHIGFAAALRSVSHRVGVRGPTELSRLAKTSLRLTKSHWGEGRLPSERTFEQYVAAIQGRARCCAYEIEPDRYDDGMGFLFEITEPLAAMHRAYYAEASASSSTDGSERKRCWRGRGFRGASNMTNRYLWIPKGAFGSQWMCAAAISISSRCLRRRTSIRRCFALCGATGAWRSRSVSSTRLIPKRSGARREPAGHGSISFRGRRRTLSARPSG